jgi:hypothetical protein
MNGGPHLELAISAEVVTIGLLRLVIAKVARVLRQATRDHFLILVEVDAPKREVDLMEPQFAWSHAPAKLMKGAKVAYVMTGRPMPLNSGQVEADAARFGVTLKCFAERDRAVDWLRSDDCVSDEAADEVRRHADQRKPRAQDASATDPPSRGVARVRLPIRPRTPRLSC